MVAYDFCNSVNTVVYACPLERRIIKWAYWCKRRIEVWQIVTEVKRSVSKNCSEIQTGSLTLNSDSSPAHYTLFVLSFTFNSQLTETCMVAVCLSGISFVSTPLDRYTCLNVAELFLKNVLMSTGCNSKKKCLLNVYNMCTCGPSLTLGTQGKRIWGRILELHWQVHATALGLHHLSLFYVKYRFFLFFFSHSCFQCCLYFFPPWQIWWMVNFCSLSSSHLIILWDIIYFDRITKTIWMWSRFVWNLKSG